MEIFRSFFLVFKEWRYGALGLSLALLSFLLISWVPNVTLLGFLSSNPAYSSIGLAKVMAVLPYEYIKDAPLQAIASALIALLFGINVACIVFSLRRFRAALVSTASMISAGGISAGLAGIACAACGSLVVSFLASLLSTAGISLYLPFRGLEISFISLALLGLSTYLVLKKVANPYE